MAHIVIVEIKQKINYKAHRTMYSAYYVLNSWLLLFHTPHLKNCEATQRVKEGILKPNFTN